MALIGDGGFCAANPSVIATAMEANIPAIWIVMDNSAFGVIAGCKKPNTIQLSAARSCATVSLIRWTMLRLLALTEPSG